MRTDAYLSDDRVYRYWLRRVWDDSLPINCSCGVNPSTADEQTDETDDEAVPPAASAQPSCPFGYTKERPGTRHECAIHKLSDYSAEAFSSAAPAQPVRIIGIDLATGRDQQVYFCSTCGKTETPCEHYDTGAKAVPPAAETARTRNSEVLADFVKYCESHPEQRFWQALRNWSGYPYIMVTEIKWLERCHHSKDTFNWEGRRHDK